MKKTLLLILTGALLFNFACSGSKGKLVEGEWETYDDVSNGGSSRVELVEAKEKIDGKTYETITLSGRTTAIDEDGSEYPYGFAGWSLNPNDATLALLKTFGSVSFKALGDGKRYTIKLISSDVEDYAYHEFHFATTEGQVEEITAQVRMFMQPAWGSPERLRQENVINLEFQTHEEWRPDNFQVKIFDLRLIP